MRLSTLIPLAEPRGNKSLEISRECHINQRWTRDVNRLLAAIFRRRKGRVLSIARSPRPCTAPLRQACRRRLITRALWGNGAGMRHTANPFGDYCYSSIARLPPELQRHSTHYGMNPRNSLPSLPKRRSASIGALVDQNRTSSWDLISFGMSVNPSELSACFPCFLPRARLTKILAAASVRLRSAGSCCMFPVQHAE